MNASLSQMAALLTWLTIALIIAIVFAVTLVLFTMNRKKRRLRNNETEE